MKERNSLSKSGTDPHRVVILSQSIRTALGEITSDFTEMKKLLQKEMSKRKVCICI